MQQMVALVISGVVTDTPPNRHYAIDISTSASVVVIDALYPVLQGHSFVVVWTSTLVSNCLSQTMSF